MITFIVISSISASTVWNTRFIAPSEKMKNEMIERVQEFKPGESKYMRQIIMTG